MSKKRTREEAMGEDAHNQSASPFMPMFEVFRKELDEHHDRRERVIKASRDITAASKKIIFSLQRVRKLGEKLPPFVTKNTAPYWQTIEERYKAVAADLQGLNAYRYSRQITGGNQEFMEALSFQHYLETQQLISFDESKKRLTELSGEGGPVMFTVDDYLLGIYDMTGELMRFSVTAIATNGKLPTGKAPKSPSKTEDGDAMEVDEQACDTKEQQKPRDVLSDLRELRLQLEMFEPPAASPFASDVEKKMVVMQQCVQKVETALYGLIVRGSERPKGWVPDLNEGRGIESY